jgi:DNA-binding response OmpR family regulator
MSVRSESGHSRPPKLVVVDDEPHIREICADVLISEGYEVATARNGREALDLLREEPADLVLMDIMMPVLDGVTACKLIRENDQTRHIPVVMMSASHNVHARLDEVQCVAAAVVPKPFDVDHLLATVRLFVA